MGEHVPPRETELVVGEYYHLYNRGNNRQPVFLERENYAFFLQQWRKYVSSVCHVVAYCLMPTHYHMLVQVTADGLSHCMQLFGISYTKSINVRYHRVGALFQGAFQAKHVNRDEYLSDLSRYIHLNPVIAGHVQRAEDWEFSSYRECLGLRGGTLPTPDIVLGQLGSRADYRAFVEAYVPEDRKAIAHVLWDED